jgi:hypothetical protein
VRLRALVVGVSATGGVLLGACGDGPSAEERTAGIVCEALRAHDRRLIDLVNTSVAGIATLPEEDRPEAIRRGFDGVETAVVSWRQLIEGIGLGDVHEVDQLRAQLVLGADRALEEIERQREQLPSGPIPDGEVQGAVGGWFNSVEKVMSVSEPQIARFERREFRRAFLDEPACRHVIQPFVDD